MIAEGFVTNGCRVYIASRNKSVCEHEAKRLSELGRMSHGVCFGIPADLQHQEDIMKLVDIIKTYEKSMIPCEMSSFKKYKT